MKLLDDTQPEARRVWIEGFRRMTPERKLTLIEGARRMVRATHAAGFRLRQPGATYEQIERDWLKLTMGELARFCRGTNSMDIDSQNTVPIILEVMKCFESLGIACALGGSWASSIHGVPRQTYDADVTCAPFPGKEKLIAAKLGSDYYVSEDAMVQANRTRSSFNVIQTFLNYKVDVFIQQFRPFDIGVLQRRLTVPAPGVANETLRVLTPEDIILHKLEWFRLGGEISDRQWSDILGVLRVQAGKLDETYLDHWANELSLNDLWQRVREQV